MFSPLQEAARRYTDTSWHIFNQSRKKTSPETKKNLNGNTYQKLESTDEFQSPSPVSDTSNGSISKSGRENSSKSRDTSSRSRETSPQSRENSPKSENTTPTLKESKQSTSQTEGTTSENESVSSILYEKIGKPDSKQIVKIETVEVTYEPMRVSMQRESVRFHVGNASRNKKLTN